MSPAATVTAVAAELLQQTARGFAAAFTPDNSRIGKMRSEAALHLQRWSLPEELVEGIVLAISELVTNAVRHSPDHISLTVLYDDAEIRIEVFDGNPKPAKLTEAKLEDTSGRGLFLVAALASNWGVSDDGMTTWCVFHALDGRP